LGYKSHLREVAERGRKLREKLAQIRSSSEKKRRYLRKETAQRRGSSMKRYISEKVAWRRLGLGIVCIQGVAHSIIQPVRHAVICTLIPPFTDSLVRSFIRSFIDSFFHSPIHPFIHTLTRYTFTHALMHLKSFKHSILKLYFILFIDVPGTMRCACGMAGHYCYLYCYLDSITADHQIVRLVSVVIVGV
jgi:hypothetical protein